MMSFTDTAIIPLSMNKADAAVRPTGRFSFANVPELTRSLRYGDEEAFRWLHAQWNARIFRYCFVLARGDESVAAEITQATYLRIFRHIRDLPDEPALWNWIARASRSAASDSRKIGARYQGAIARFAEWLRPRQVSQTDHLEILGTQTEGDGLLEALDRAIASLTAEENALIEKRYSEGRSLEEIGHSLGVSARAVEGRLARLRRKLRVLLNKSNGR